MAKRLSNPHTWHARSDAAPRRLPASLTLRLLAVPLLVLGALLLIDGVMSLNPVSMAIGVIGLVAASGLHRQGQRLEHQDPEAFHG